AGWACCSAAMKALPWSARLIASSRHTAWSTPRASSPRSPLAWLEPDVGEAEASIDGARTTSAGARRAPLRRTWRLRRPSQKIPLSELGSSVDHRGQLRFGLDALGHHLGPQLAAQGDHAADQTLLAGMLVDVTDQL